MTGSGIIALCGNGAFADLKAASSLLPMRR